MPEAASPGFPTRTRPLAALAAVLRLVRDKESTREVFNVTRALDGPISEALFVRFAASPVGARVLAERIDLDVTLRDRAALAALPEGSLGRAYLEFVAAERLSVESFRAEMEATGERFERTGEDRRRLILRLRHCHDLLHVLAGYGRDLPGELALLAFTRAQTKSRGLALIMGLGLVKAWRVFPGVPVLACLEEGARLGRAAEDFVTADWEGLLPLPLEEARRRLGMGVPARYWAIRGRAEAIDRGYRAQLAAARG